MSGGGGGGGTYRNPASRQAAAVEVVAVVAAKVAGAKGRGGGGGHAGAAKADTELGKRKSRPKLAHREMQRDTLNHQEWDLAREAAYWRAKLATVDAGSKTGLKLREKILTLEDQLSNNQPKPKSIRWRHGRSWINTSWIWEKDAADQALAAGRISQLERLDLEIEFENRRYQIAYDALQERIALAEQDPTYSQSAIDKLETTKWRSLATGHE